MSDNPFSPGFGATPLVLAGRDGDLEAIREVCLDISRSDYGRTIVISGQRGVGKTVLLNHAEDIAREGDWLVASETVTTGFVNRIVDDVLIPSLPESSKTSLSASIGIAIPPITASIGVASRSVAAGSRPNRGVGLRPVVTALVEANPGRGILFTLDEVGNRSVGEIESFVTAYQHFIREGYPVGMVIGGIPAMLSRLLTRNDSATTFLNRARRVTLNPLPYDMAAAAFRDTIALRGTRSASEEAVRAMAFASRGYPFLIQEIGKLAWDVHPDSELITEDDVAAILCEAQRAFADSVLSVIVASLPRRPQEMLTAIAKNPGIHTTQLAAEMGMRTTAMPELRQKLIAAGVVIPDGTGVVRIVIPYLQEYLATSDHEASAAREALAVADSYNIPGQ